jgi:LysM repeat protein
MGESPAIIAKKYGVKVDELMKANNITDPKRVQYGQRLVIPSVATAAATPAAPAATTTAPAPTATPTASAAHPATSEPALAAPVVTTGPAMIE